MKKFALLSLLILGGGILSNAQGVSTVKFTSFEIVGDSIASWKASETKNPVYYIVSQYRWNRWVDWDTLKSSPGRDTGSYTLNVSKYTHEGINKFRIRAVNELVTMLVYSKAISFTSTKAKARAILKEYSTAKHIIDFGRKECYELYSKDGTLIKKGCAQMVGLSTLVKGSYYLNYDNINAEFKFK